MLITALVVLSSIGLHMLIPHHEHPDFMGEKIEAAFHGESERWLLVALAVVAIFSIQNFAEIFARERARFLKYFFPHRESGSNDWRTYDFLHAYATRGLLHPKTW